MIIITIKMILLVIILVNYFFPCDQQLFSFSFVLEYNGIIPFKEGFT